MDNANNRENDVSSLVTDNALPEVRMGLWQYVSSAQQNTPINRDRAVEYVRKHCTNRDILRLFLGAVSIACGQIKKRENDVLVLTADFMLDMSLNSTAKPYRYVAMNMDIRKENPSIGPFAITHHQFEITLMVDSVGEIVDVDCMRLATQIQKL